MIAFCKIVLYNYSLFDNLNILNSISKTFLIVRDIFKRSFEPKVLDKHLEYQIARGIGVSEESGHAVSSQIT